MCISANSSLTKICISLHSLGQPETQNTLLPSKYALRRKCLMFALALRQILSGYEKTVLQIQLTYECQLSQPVLYAALLGAFLSKMFLQHYRDNAVPCLLFCS